MRLCLAGVVLFVAIAGGYFYQPCKLITPQWGAVELVPVSGVIVQDDEQRAAAAQQAYDQLQKEYQAELAALRKEVEKLESKQDQVQLLLSKNPASKYVEKHLELAKNYRATPAAMDALLFVIGLTKDKQKNDAMMMLLEQHADDLSLDKMAESFKREVPSQYIENWYLKMIELANRDSDKAAVRYHYAKYVSQFSLFKRTLEMNPQVASKLSQEQIDYIGRPRSEEQQKAMAGHLRTIIDQFADVPIDNTTYGALATKQLFDLENLQVGQIAPDIVGNDLDGVEFRLSDYRGKVVLLDFWGHWCPPCRRLYSTEQELNLKLADAPFVLLGVNSDRKLETARTAVENEGLSWRHYWNGPKGTAGPISEQWNVEGWPTFYLIDADGVIRYKEIGAVDIEAGIQTLMAELGHEVQFDKKP